MRHKREDGAEYPCSHHSRTPESRLFRDVFEIEDIFYETEAERYEYREEHSFFHGVDEGKRTRQDAEVLAGLLYESYDDIVKKHELQGSEHRSGDSDSPIREGSVKHIEPKKQEVKEGKEYADAQNNACIFQKSFPAFPEVIEEYPCGEDKDACCYQPDGDKERHSKSHSIITL